MRKRYLIAYDIADNKRRTSVYNTLMANGDHLQFSVFLCELNALELVRLKGVLHQEINSRRDQIVILDMGPARNELSQRLECIGKAFSPPTRVMIV